MKKLRQVLSELYTDFDENAISESLKGYSKQKAISKIRGLVDSHVRGIFTDDAWKPVNTVFTILRDNGIKCNITSSEYQKENGIPIRKIWAFNITFINDKQRPIILHGRIVAAGAGSVQDPLDKYDVTFTLG